MRFATVALLPLAAAACAGIDIPIVPGKPAPASHSALSSTPSPTPAGPQTQDMGGRTGQTGYATWYGPKFHGRMTASGERYNMNALSAAHPSLPFQTELRVTNLADGRSVTVRVNDRGPFRGGFIIDLSQRAAKEIGLDRSGTGLVSVMVIPPPDLTELAARAQQ